MWSLKQKMIYAVKGYETKSYLLIILCFHVLRLEGLKVKEQKQK